MPEQWTAEVVGKLHLLNISKKQLANKLGYTPEYVSMVLNGHRAPVGAEQAFIAAVDRLAEQNNHTMQSVQKNGQ